MPHFDGKETLRLDPYTVDYPVSETFETCTSATANDGSIPYGDTISSAQVLAYDPDGNDVTSDLVTVAATVDGDSVDYALSYYSGIPTGTHSILAILTLASGAVLPFTLRRVLVTQGVTPSGSATPDSMAAHMLARDNPHVVTFAQLTTGIDTYDDNAAALAGGLAAGEVYRTSTGVLMVVYTP